MDTIKSKLVEAETPQLLQKEVDLFLMGRADSFNRLFGDRDNPGTDPREFKEIINVQQYTTQVLELNRLTPGAPPRQTIRYYLLIIYK